MIGELIRSVVTEGLSCTEISKLAAHYDLVAGKTNGMRDKCLD